MSDFLNVQVPELSADMEKIVDAVSLLLETAMLSVEETDPIMRRLLHAQQQMAVIKKNSTVGYNDD